MLAKAETRYDTGCSDFPPFLGGLWASVPHMKRDANPLIKCLPFLNTIRFIFQYVTTGVVLIAIIQLYHGKEEEQIMA